MSLRYAIESLIFFVILLIFQFEISAFNKDLHLSIQEIEEFKQLNEEIVKHGGLLYRQDRNLQTVTVEEAKVISIEIRGIEISTFTLEQLMET